MIGLVLVASLLLILLMFCDISNEVPYDRINNKLSGSSDSWFSNMHVHQASASVKWLNYSKPNIQLKMQYPSDWQKIENQNNVTLSLSQNGSLGSEKGNVSIESYPSGNEPLEEHVGLGILNYRKHLPNFVLNNSVTDIFGENTTAHKILYSYTNVDNHEPHTVTEFWTIIDGKVYLIKYQAEATRHYSANLPIVEKIIDSIHIERTAIFNVTSQNYPSLAFDITHDPYDIAVNPINNMLYITNLRSDKVSVMDGAIDKILADIKVGTNPEGVTIRLDNNMIYVANSGSNTVSVIDGSTNSVLSNITVGLNPADLDTDTLEEGLDSFVFVANTDSNTTSVIDTRENNVISNITVGNKPASLILNPITNRLYVANSGSNTVSVIDYFISNNQTFRTDMIANISVGNYPVKLELDQDTNRLYVANSESDTVSVVDGSTNKVIENIPVGEAPYSVAFDKKSDKLYVANYDSNTVSLIDASTNKVTSNVTVGRYPVNVALNPVTDIVYVSNLGTRSLSEIKDSSLMTGIDFNISPPEAGFLSCNGDRIEDNDYIRYKFNSTITCGANHESDFVFGSWSGDIDFSSSNEPETTFKTSKYGNVTANFEIPSIVTLPEGYWTQLTTILLTVMIPAILGWFVPAIAAWFNGIRQRRNLRKYVNDISVINNEFKDKIKEGDNKLEYLKKLESLQTEIKNALTRWKISESQYQILLNAISNDQNNMLK
jgi:YVTN family beta-propeller protein